MNYIDMVMRLQLMYEGKIVLISCGSFYIAIGTDAIILNKKLKLKLNCIKRRVCKVGVPKNSIDKYIELLGILGYSFIVFDYNKDTHEIIMRYKKEGKRVERGSFSRSFCNNCDKNLQFEKSEYEEALCKYVRNEFGEEFIW